MVITYFETGFPHPLVWDFESYLWIEENSLIKSDLIHHSFLPKPEVQLEENYKK